ncbi:SGNH/GDSL hydrolase family protein [Enterococcus casseliflavus]|uniref:GDSL-type esterase/lipase family protein n=1 Tax=Enterococcus casseliflavus TaxID=37734 RepID=A0ABD5FMD4_ENTCA|nr:SGNH/GDSL hydrolase family protein [Enterococcus casseliflavus]MDT2982713.1 GDSL-type esterase/lipase family protein [Enterococcus casseliflavus]
MVEIKKLIERDSQGTPRQVFPESHIEAVLGLEERLNDIEVGGGASRVTEYYVRNLSNETLKKAKNYTDEILAGGIADQTVAYAEVKDESLNYNNVDFLKVSKNRFNPAILQPNGFHNYTTGVWTSSPYYDTSGKIPCRPGQVWTARYTRWVCYFDKNKAFKTGGFASGGTDELKTFTIPEGVYYFEATCQKVHTDDQQVELGSVLSPYNSFSMEIDKLKVNINEAIDIKRDSLSVDKMDFIKQGKNLFDLNKSTKGYYVNPTTGLLNSSPNYLASAMIPTYGNKVSIQGIKFYALYNKDGGFLSGDTLTESKTIPASDEHYWIRVSPTSRLEGAAQVEYGDITEYEPYRAVLKGVKTESEFQSIPSINLPSTVYATVNKELVIFKNNILLDKGYDFRWGRGIQGELAYRETFDQVGDKTLSIEIYREGKLITSKSVLVKVNAPRSTPITAMIIGDSTVASATTEPSAEARLGYHMLQEMGSNLKLVGIRGIGASKHEGRGGWTAKDYRSNKTDQTGTNPFYNPSTQDFDFAYYMENTNQDVPGLVFIQLGINDLFNYSTDEQAVTKVDEFINDVKFIAANIKAYNSNIKIAYNIAIPPTEKIDVFATTYSNYNLPQWRYKRNNSLLAEKVIEELSSDNNLILNPIHKGINVFENIRDGVHPTDDGYKELASENVDFINGLN